MPMTRDELLAGAKPRVETIDVPAWGGQVCVKVLSGDELDGFGEASEGMRGVDVMAFLLCRTLCDAEGVRLFTDHEHTVIRGMAGAGLIEVGQAAMKLNALTEKDVEELAGNSPAATGGDSG